MLKILCVMVLLGVAGAANAAISPNCSDFDWQTGQCWEPSTIATQGLFSYGWSIGVNVAVVGLDSECHDVPLLSVPGTRVQGCNSHFDFSEANDENGYLESISCLIEIDEYSGAIVGNSCQITYY